MVGVLLDILIAFGRYYDGLSTACLDLGDVAHNFVILRPGCGNKDRRHPVNY